MFFKKEYRLTNSLKSSNITIGTGGVGCICVCKNPILAMIYRIHCKEPQITIIITLKRMTRH